VHVWNQEADQPQNVDGVATFSEQLGKISPGAQYKVVVFELNADKHGVQRALGTAHAINQLQRIGDRVRIVCSANGLQPDGQNDNGWNQGLLFLNPSQVWGQPPYYGMQMLAQHALPRCVRAEVQDATDALDVTALTDAAGKILQIQVLNFKAEPIPTHLLLDGFWPAHAAAQVTSLSGPLDAVNTASAPTQIVPSRHPWRHNLHDGATDYTFPGHSFTILRFE
jgi:alpha-L-arabinofuranosidase